MTDPTINHKLTIVCVKCTAGWEIQRGDVALCPYCGDVGIIRGETLVIDLTREKG